MADARVSALAREMLDAYSAGRQVPIPPSAREGGIDLDTGYAVEGELTRLRRASGRNTVGRKLGLGNRAVWKTLNLQTLVWASMYDDTVHFARNGHGTQSLARMRAPKMEPEIVVKFRSAPAAAEPVAVLEAVEWMSLGFEFIDIPYPNWKMHAGDFMATFGLHAALFVGEPRPIRRDDIPALIENLATFTVSLSKNGVVAEQGGGKNVLESPALALAEFVSALPERQGAEPIKGGEIITTGSLTTPPAVVAGERWSLEAAGLDISPLAVDLVP